MTKLILSVLTAAILLSSCSNKTGARKTITGYDYVVYSDAAGPNAVPGQVAYFDFEILDDKENVIQSTKGTPNPPNILLPVKDDPLVKENPIIGLLYNSSVGDSLGLILPKDSIPNAPPQYKDVSHFVYRVKVTEILSEEEHKARVDAFTREKQEQAAALAGREAEVATFAQETAASYRAGTLKGLQEGPEGIKYVIHEEGTGPNAEAGQFVSAQYYGYLEDGKMFDNSFKRGKGFGFKLGQGSVIRGWDVGFTMLNQGAKATIFIPSEIGYGKRGSPPNIGPDQDLIFYVELEEVR